MADEPIAVTIERMGISREQFCLLCAIDEDDLHALDEGAAIPSHRVAAIVKLIRYCGGQKLAPVLAILDQIPPPREWRQIAEFPQYEVSDDGLVRRRTSSGKGAVRTLKLILRPDGYLKVTLYRNARPEPQSVHRLVCVAFNGAPPPDRPNACHEDGNKSHNRRSNLYWGTAVENAADWQRHRRQKIERSVQTPYNLMTTPEIRAGIRLGKINKSKGVQVILSRRRKK